jgi:hypothetical protein
MRPDTFFMRDDVSAYVHDFTEDFYGRFSDRYSAVAVTGPRYREFHDPVAVMPGQEDDFDVEDESVGLAHFVERPGHVTAIYLEPALSVGQAGRNFKQCVDSPSEEPGTDSSDGRLFFLYQAAWGFP